MTLYRSFHPPEQPSHREQQCDKEPDYDRGVNSLRSQIVAAALVTVALNGFCNAGFVKLGQSLAVPHLLGLGIDIE